MTRGELLEALRRLGELLPENAQIVIAGGAALILGDHVDRGTGAGDVVYADPPLVQLRSAILQVAQERGLSPLWLNDGVKAFGDALPDDFDQRTDRMGTFGNLRVLLLGPMGLILSRFYGGRVVDLADLDENPENAAKKAAHSGFYANIDENPERARLPPPSDPDPLRISTKIRKTPSKARRFPDFRPANPTPLSFPLDPEPSLETRRTGRAPKPNPGPTSGPRFGGWSPVLNAASTSNGRRARKRYSHLDPRPRL